MVAVSVRKDRLERGICLLEALCVNEANGDGDPLLCVQDGDYDLVNEVHVSLVRGEVNVLLKED